MSSIIPKPIRDFSSDVSTITSRTALPSAKKASAERMVKTTLRASIAGICALATYQLGLAAAPVLILGAVVSLPSVLLLANTRCLYISVALLGTSLATGSLLALGLGMGLGYMSLSNLESYDFNMFKYGIGEQYIDQAAKSWSNNVVNAFSPKAVVRAK
jgi:hypothetical protein